MKMGQFVILGEGTYGQVLLARHKTEGHLLAIKLVKADEYVLEDTLKEASLGMLLNKTNATSKCYGVVFTHIDGKHAPVGMVHGFIGDPSSFESFTVDKIINTKEERDAMTTMHCLQLVHDLAKCVEAIHKLGILCTDLKENNIMASKDSRSRWNIKVIDFGMATYKTDKAPLTFPKRMHTYMHERHPHVPLDYFSSGVCAPSTDVFAIGYIADMVSKVICRSSSLRLLAKACMQVIPTHRPSLKQLLKNVTELMEMESIKDSKESKRSRIPPGMTAEEDEKRRDDRNKRRRRLRAD